MSCTSAAQRKSRPEGRRKSSHATVANSWLPVWLRTKQTQRAGIAVIVSDKADKATPTRHLFFSLPRLTGARPRDSLIVSWTDVSDGTLDQRVPITGLNPRTQCGQGEGEAACTFRNGAYPNLGLANLNAHPQMEVDCTDQELCKIAYQIGAPGGANVMIPRPKVRSAVCPASQSR